MKRFWKISLALLVLLAILSIGAVLMIGNQIFQGITNLTTNKDTSLESSYRFFEKIEFDLKAFETAYTVTSIAIPSTHSDHEIPASWISSDGDHARDTVVMVHGLGGNRLTVFPVAEMFLRNGFNVIAYDQRSSGENTAPYNTFGYLEKNDLADVVDYVISQAAEPIQIGVWGVSFGGATVGLYLGSDASKGKLAFAVLDSPVSDGKEMTEMGLQQIDMGGLPVPFALQLGNLMLKQKLGFDDVNVPAQIAQADDIPILIVTSELDTVTPPHMGQDIFTAIQGNRKLMLTVADSEHADVFFDYPDLYEEKIHELIALE